MTARFLLLHILHAAHGDACGVLPIHGQTSATSHAWPWRWCESLAVCWSIRLALCYGHLNVCLSLDSVIHGGGWTMEAPQFWWGHKADKLTWLYCVGCEPHNMPDVPLVLGEPSHVVQSRKRDSRPHITKAEREHTPEPLARWLVELATRCTQGASFSRAV